MSPLASTASSRARSRSSRRLRPQPRNKFPEVSWRLGHDLQLAPVVRVTERQPVRVQRMATELNRTKAVRSVDVALLADKCVAAQPRLNANLVATAGSELDFDQAGPAQRFDGPV